MPKMRRFCADGEVAGQGRVDGGEIRARQRLRAVRREVDALDADAPGARLQHAEDHVDGGGLAGAVGAQQPDDLVAAHCEGDAVYGDRVAVGLCAIRARKARSASPGGPESPGEGAGDANSLTSQPGLPGNRR